ncbi:MAG: two component system sensor kinase [Acidimicrobiales bacterium]|jgi:signal transduction histidine kinase|nr:two component system sensor kinase [Acidimicrobiales bacterium]
MPPLALWASALVVGVIQVGGSFGAAHDQPDRLAIDGVAIGLLLLGPAALAVRGRWPLVGAGVPLLAADVYLGRGYPYGPIFLSVIVGLVTAVLAGERTRAWLLSGLGLVGYPLAVWLVGRGSELPPLLHLLLVAGWISVVLAVADLVRSRRLETAERFRRRMSEERLGIARDVHDVLAHNISMINVQAGVALHLFDERPEQARTALANIKDASREALHELRSALEVLRYGDDRAVRAPAPGLAELDRLVDRVRAGGLDVRTETAGEPVALPASIDLAAYRIVQEALTNVTRHAQARAAVVRIRYGDAMMIEVLDDGRGGTATAGNGIVGMRERAVALGGTLDAGPAPDGGFAVVAVLPVPS